METLEHLLHVSHNLGMLLIAGGYTLGAIREVTHIVRTRRRARARDEP